MGLSFWRLIFEEMAVTCMTEKTISRFRSRSQRHREPESREQVLRHLAPERAERIRAYREPEEQSPKPELPGAGENDTVASDSNGHKVTDSNAHSSSGSSGGYGPGRGYGYYSVRNEAGPGQPVGDSRWNGGQWRQDANGWWFAGTDGSYPKAGWAQLEWNGQKLWYHFDTNGYMSTGWIQDGGNCDYLHAAGDGNRGFMHTGWQEIGGKWYYFHKDTDGAALPVGAMLSNTVTPDGYTVGSDGAWI